MLPKHCPASQKAHLSCGWLFFLPISIPGLAIPRTFFGSRLKALGPHNALVWFVICIGADNSQKVTVAQVRKAHRKRTGLDVRLVAGDATPSDQAQIRDLNQSGNDVVAFWSIVEPEERLPLGPKKDVNRARVRMEEQHDVKRRKVEVCWGRRYMSIEDEVADYFRTQKY